MLLTAERAAGIRGKDANLRERQPDKVGDDPLEPVGVLDGAPDRDAVTVGCGHECMRFDRELGDHRERVGALDDDVGLHRRSFDVAPAIVVLAEDVRARARIIRSERRVLDERRAGRERGRDVVEPGQLLVLDPDEASGLLGGVEGLRPDRGNRLAVILGLICREDRPIAALRAEARRRIGQVGRRHDDPDPGHRQGGTGVDRADSRARHGERDKLDVERVVVRQVGDILLASGHTGEPADARCRLADDARSSDVRRSGCPAITHCGATPASGVADRSPMVGVDRRSAAPSGRPAEPAAASTASMICS